jgi:hypothetical protein
MDPPSGVVESTLWLLGQADSLDRRHLLDESRIPYHKIAWLPSTWRRDGRLSGEVLIMELGLYRGRWQNYKNSQQALLSDEPGLMQVKGLEKTELYPVRLTRQLNNVDVVCDDEQAFWEIRAQASGPKLATRYPGHPSINDKLSVFSLLPRTGEIRLAFDSGMFVPLDSIPYLSWTFCQAAGDWESGRLASNYGVVVIADGIGTELCDKTIARRPRTQ